MSQFCHLLCEPLKQYISEKWKPMWNVKGVDAITSQHSLKKPLWGGYRLLATLTGSYPYGGTCPCLKMKLKEVQGKKVLSPNQELYFFLRCAKLSKAITDTANKYFENITDIPCSMQSMCSPGPNTGMVDCYYGSPSHDEILR